MYYHNVNNPNHYHHHPRLMINQNGVTYYVEMLLPRRKGQLLKLLILVPLSLLLATSIYYQFYYEQPASQRPPLPSQAGANPMPLVYNALVDYTGDSFMSDSSQELTGSDVNKEAAAGQQPKLEGHHNSNWPDNDSYLNKRRQQNKNMRLSGSSQISAQNDGLQSEDDSNNNYNYKLHYKLSDKIRPLKQRKQQQQQPANGNNLINIDDANTSNNNNNNNYQSDETFVAVSSGAAREYNYDSRDNQQLALDRRLKLQTLTELSNSSSSSSDDISSQLDSSDSSANASEAVDLLREEEEADAQDAAVIPPPSDPTGPGELGRPVVLKNLTKEQQNLVNVGWENNAFNQYISDIISVNRTLPDVRDPSCKNLKYTNIRRLPQTSVIICFHNEAWSVLLRTVHSILNRSPRRLVKEIILVDDFSNKPHLGQQLEDYIKPLRIVKVVRAKKREGLIRARLLGAQASTAPVLTFLDSHCECAEGWLEPLLSRIHQDSTAVVCPVIDVISDKTFEYHYKGDASAISVGGFDWNLQFNWHSVPDREKKRRKNPYDPLRSPTMAGGLFSIDKAFFERLGTYDSGFDIWGGENLELSFKTWMCGGTLEILPCSHVGHVFRSRSPYKWRTGVNVLKRNSVRLAEVWMDDYKKYYYDRIGHELGDYGDISERVELRKSLSCKPFSYFVKEIYPELFIPGEAVAYGEVRNEAEGKIKMCLDSSARKSDYHKPLGVYPCHGSGGNQYWLLSRDGEIRRDEACVDYAGHDVILFPCHGSGGNQLWFYEKDTKQVRHSTSGRCMELARGSLKLGMSDCDPTNDAQKWTFQHYNASLAAIH